MAADKAEQKRKLARDLEVELGEDYHMDMRNHWDLKIPDEKHDVLPEIFLGKNVADFIDPDIMKVCALFKDGAYYCYCAYVLRIFRYSDFLSPMLTNTGIFLHGLKLSGESRS